MNPIRSCWAIRYKEEGGAWGLLCKPDLTPECFSSKTDAIAFINDAGMDTWAPVRLVPAPRRKKKVVDAW